MLFLPVFFFLVPASFQWCSSGQTFPRSNTVLDTESEVLDLMITKTKKSLGIVLQMDEQEKVVFINDIVNSDISILKAGDQILRINNKKIDSVQGITQIVSQADIGNDIEFKIKRPKKEVNWQVCKLKTQS